MVAGTFHVPSAVFNEMHIEPWLTAQRSVPATLCCLLTAQRSVPASAPLKAFNQLGASPDQGNVTALYPTVVTAFP